MKQIAKLLKFSVAGHTLHYSQEGFSHCHCTGHEDPESFCKPYHWWAHPADQMSRHWDGYEFPEEGIPVIDIREAIETPEGYSWVFNGPMLDCNLPDGEIDRLGEVSPMMLPAIEAYGQGVALLATIAAKSKGIAGPLDDVSVSEYVAGWKAHGAKVGRCFVEGDICRIEWD
jgi:hypothetical protein